MTEENYRYRTNPMFLRNQFGHGTRYGIPTIPKTKLNSFPDQKLIAFDRTKQDQGKHSDRIVHFFLYDYKFEKMWTEPDRYIEQVKAYRAVLSPDFSMYLEMPDALLLYNTFRNRWCGAYMAQKGMEVIPTVNWGNPSSFDFCFEGIEKGSPVAVSTYMVTAHGNHADQKEFFLKGYNEMLRRIEPEYILCYNGPFPEMAGNIITIDYDSSSWTSLKEDKGIVLPQKPGIIVRKAGYVLCQDLKKGTGSAFGGDWTPSKDEDKRLVGVPGEIKEYLKSNGERYETKIGETGYAVRERHYTDHGWPKYHSVPHDHIIKWEDNHPVFAEQINYYDDVPEFKAYRGGKSLVTEKNILDFSKSNFQTIGEFKECMRCGGEVEFEWKGVQYGVVRYGKDHKITIYEAYKLESEMVCETADDALEYMLGEDRFRDVLSQVTILFRSI